MDARRRNGGAYTRHELKFPLPVALVDEIRSRVESHVEPDPNAAGDGRAVYTVRSIYFDTEDLRFYFEKIDGRRTRRKLRIRTYGSKASATNAFLEIKRKLDRTSFKERARVPVAAVSAILSSRWPDPPDAAALDRVGERERRVIEKFRYNMDVCELRPSVLVTYDREPYVATRGDMARVTFDMNLRSLIRPGPDDLFSERPLREFHSGGFVLELKFDEFMPRWMADLMSAFNLRSRAFSKYCHGIDAWECHAK